MIPCARLGYEYMDQVFFPPSLSFFFFFMVPVNALRTKKLQALVSPYMAPADITALTQQYNLIVPAPLRNGVCQSEDVSLIATAFTHRALLLEVF